MELKIDLLNLNIENAAGHEHRIRPITTRAAAIFSRRAGDVLMGGGPAGGFRQIDEMSGAPVNINLPGSSDQQAAEAIANAWLQALLISLRS